MPFDIDAAEWPSDETLKAEKHNDDDNDTDRDPTSSTDCFRRLLETYLFAHY